MIFIGFLRWNSTQCDARSTPHSSGFRRWRERLRRFEHVRARRCRPRAPFPHFRQIVKQLAKISRPAGEIGDGVCGIYAEVARRRRHQLGKAHRALGRQCLGVPAALLPDQRRKQRWADVGGCRGLLERRRILRGNGSRADGRVRVSGNDIGPGLIDDLVGSGG